MARFVQAPPEQAPERLMRFCWREWPDLAPEQSIRAWHDARMAWHNEHATIGPDGAPESIIGTFVDLFRQKRVVHLRWGNAQDLRTSETAPCTEAECDGDRHCALRRVAS